MKCLVSVLILCSVVGCASRSSLATLSQPATQFDVVIENGRIVDGSGAAWFYGDVGIVGDRINTVVPRGMLRDVKARQRIDATNMVVAPGFIDIQSGSTNSFLRGDSRVNRQSHSGCYN